MLKINFHLSDNDYSLMKKGFVGDDDFDLNLEVEECLMNNSTIRMEELQKNIIPIINSDVFISYSHKDTKYAKTLAETLQLHELSTFVDCFYWKSIDDALKIYDNLYCKKKSGSYDYEKRNKSTATFHMILADSIIDVVKNSKVFIRLISTNYSDSNDRTISPWIYLENKVAELCPNEKIKDNKILVHDSLKEHYITFKTTNKGFIDVYNIKELIDILYTYFE